MNFSKFYLVERDIDGVEVPSDPNAWLEKKVTHKTPTGQLNKIKLKNLSAAERFKYAPYWFKKLTQLRKERLEAEGKDSDNFELKLDTEQGDDSGSKSTSPNSTLSQRRYNKKRSKKSKKNKDIEVTTDKPINPYTLDFYFFVEDPDKFNVVSKDVRIKATTDAFETREEEANGKYVCEVLKVPMGAIRSHKVEDKWFKYNKDLTDEDKFNKIKFSDDVWFKLDLYPFLEDVRFNLLSDMEGEEE